MAISSAIRRLMAKLSFSVMLRNFATGIFREFLAQSIVIIEDLCIRIPLVCLTSALTQFSVTAVVVMQRVHCVLFWQHLFSVCVHHRSAFKKNHRRYLPISPSETSNHGLAILDPHYRHFIRGCSSSAQIHQRLRNTIACFGGLLSESSDQKKNEHTGVSRV